MSERPKVLVIRFSSIGDIVLTTPVYRILKQQAKAEVHLLTKRTFSFSVKGNPHIDKVIEIDKNIDEKRDELKEESYDFVVDLHKNIRSMQVKRLLGVPSRAFNKLNVEKWMLVNLKMDRMPPEPHIVYRYCAAAEPLGVKYDGKGMEFAIPGEDEVDVSAMSGGMLFPEGFISVAIGASKPTKALTEEQISQLVGHIHKPVALLGGPGDRDEAGRIAQAYDHVVAFAGELTLQQSASVVKQSSVLISPDTGMMHICAALDHPVISVWGNTVPRMGMTPFYPQNSSTRWDVVEVANLKCRPCSKIGYDKCPKGHFKCIMSLNMARLASLAVSY